MTKEYVMTPEHEAILEQYKEKFTANAFYTGPMTDEDRTNAVPLVKQLYKIAGQDEPVVVFADGAMSGAVLAGIAEVHLVGGGDPAKIPEFARRVNDGFARWAETRSAADEWAVRPSNDMMRAMAAECGVDGDKAIAEIRQANSVAQGGREWSAWDCELTFYRDVAKFDESYGVAQSVWDNYAPWEALSYITSRRYMLVGCAIVCDNPSTLHVEIVDGNGRLHCPNGPAKVYRDRVEVYAWHGTYVPERWIMEPGALTAQVALAEDNTEKRRAACEILGWAKVLDQLDARIIDKDPDEKIGTLYEADLPDAPGERFLKAKCGTGRDVVVIVDKSAQTAIQANAMSYGVPESLLRVATRS